MVMNLLVLLEELVRFSGYEFAAVSNMKRLPRCTRSPFSGRVGSNWRWKKATKQKEAVASPTMLSKRLERLMIAINRLSRAEVLHVTVSWVARGLSNLFTLALATRTVKGSAP